MCENSGAAAIVPEETLGSGNQSCADRMFNISGRTLEPMWSTVPRFPERDLADSLQKGAQGAN